MIIFFTKLRRKIPAPAYRLARKLFVSAQVLIPFETKLRFYGRVAKKTVPYSLIRGDDCVLQIGMPSDLLNQGRSRSLLFHFLGPKTLVLVEPDANSVATGHRIFNSFKNARTETIIFEGAVSTFEGKLFLEIANNRQATNKPVLSETIRKTKLGDGKLQTIEVRALPIAVYANRAPDLPSVLSVTTNGGELAVVRQYLGEIQKKDWPRIICIAPPQSGLEIEFEKLGYTSLGLDDRGLSFERNS
ncbi:hypothetical protein IMCC14465_05060 [alpha proteobacterium IMCC14465]|uniref:Uncharacterized protein n=1 Tax=alpha proteobacterium IMCC14465 TaxID=1220535 RepID=J9DYN3_9PROT|nr:hypothetical protein IMCC14465_05060 [alpha proteobacterium IMCC14465]